MVPGDRENTTRTHTHTHTRWFSKSKLTSGFERFYVIKCRWKTASNVKDPLNSKEDRVLHISKDARVYRTNNPMCMMLSRSFEKDYPFPHRQSEIRAARTANKWTIDVWLMGSPLVWSKQECWWKRRESTETSAPFAIFTYASKHLGHKKWISWLVCFEDKGCVQWRKLSIKKHECPIFRVKSFSFWRCGDQERILNPLDSN